MHLDIRKLMPDEQFLKHFRNLQQVFLYITDQCNLRCVHCLYKPNLVLARDIKLETALSLLVTFREMGAYKLSVIGGEPTRYGHTENNKPLFDLIKESRNMGYEYIRMDTNGQFGKEVLENAVLQSLDNLSFSIDGHNANIDDKLRGEGSFHRALENLRYAVKLGYNVHVTTCVTKYNIGYDKDGDLLLDKMIYFAEKEGVETINFHCVFLLGTPMDTWTGDVHLSPKEWMKVYSIIRRNIDLGKYKINVRLPQHIVTRKEFNDKPDYYGYCPAKMGERVLVHPNGIIRICSSFLATAYGVARYDDERIHWETVTNELYKHELDKNTPCTNQTASYKDDLVPLCFSFKPRQNEIVWKRIGRDKYKESCKVDRYMVNFATDWVAEKAGG